MPLDLVFTPTILVIFAVIALKESSEDDCFIDESHVENVRQRNEYDEIFVRGHCHHGRSMCPHRESFTPQGEADVIQGGESTQLQSHVEFSQHPGQLLRQDVPWTNGRNSSRYQEWRNLNHHLRDRIRFDLMQRQGGDDFNPTLDRYHQQRAKYVEENLVIGSIGDMKLSTHEECSICLQTYDMDDTVAWAKTSQCGHCYHIDCITKWLQINNECPLCRGHMLPLQQS